MADNTESIGGVSVVVSADTSGVGPALKSVQQDLDQTSQKLAIFTALLAQSYTEEGKAAQAAQQLANALRQTAAAAQSSTPALTAFEKALLAVAQAESAAAAATAKATTAQHAAVSEIQATSGALRTLDGNGGIRAAERFLATTVGLGPALQAIFPIVGALAFAEIIARGVEHLAKFAKGGSDAATEIRRAFREINLGAQESNDSLQVANDRLENEIAKIEKKPENGIKLALDEAILSADQLGKSLDADLSKLTKVLTEQKTGLAGQIFGQASTSDIEDEVQRFQDRVAKVTASSKIPRQESFGGVSLFAPQVLEGQKTAEQTRVNTELTGLYSAELQKLQHELQTAYGAGAQGAVDNTRRVEILTQAIANLKAQAQSIDLKSVNANLQGEKGKAQANADSQRQAEEAANRALEQLHRQIEAFEAQLRAYAQAKRAQDELNAAAEKLYQTTHRLADESAKVAQNLRLSGVELANKSSEALSGQRPPTRGEQERQGPVNQPALQRLQGGNAVQQQLALAIQLKQVGIETNSEIQSRIGTLQLELAAAERLNVPIAERLKLEKEILDARIAAATANGQTDNADKLAAANVDLQKTLTEWRALGLGDAAQAIEQVLVKTPDVLGSALAKGIFDHGKGQSIGKDVGQGLKGEGQQLAGKLMSMAIEKLIATIAIQTGLQAAWNAIFPVTQTAAVVATTANTAALGLLTAAIFTQTALLGFADGTSSAPGGFAVVGERGPEIVNIPRGAQVIPNHKIKGYADGTPGYTRSYGGASHSTSIGELHVHAHGVNDPGSFARAAVAAIPHELKRQSSSFSPYSH